MLSLNTGPETGKLPLFTSFDFFLRLGKPYLGLFRILVCPFTETFNFILKTNKQKRTCLLCERH